MTNVFSWQNSVSFCPASFCTRKPNLPVIPGISLTSYFCIPLPCNEKSMFFWCQFQKVLQVFIELFSFNFFSISGWVIDLDYCDVECLPWKQTEIILSFLRLHPSTAFQTLVDYEGATPFVLRDSCPQYQIQWSSELNLSISSILIH